MIGAGNMGKNHIRVYSELEGAEFVAFSDVDERVCKDLSEKYSVPGYGDYLEMVEKEDIDIVSICVPTSLHFEIGKACISKGLQVLLEKPVADTVERAEELLRLSEEQKTKLLIGHIERFNPAVIKVKEIVESGNIGKIVSVIARRVGGFPPQIQDANVAVDLAIHDIDIVNYFLDELPYDIACSKKKNHLEKREDSVDFFLKYPSASAYIQANWITPVKIRKLSITGTEGYLELDCLNQKIDFYKSNYEKLKLSYEDYSDFILKYASSDVVNIDVDKKEPLKEEILYFLNCVRNDKKIDSQFAVDALKIAIS